MSKTKTIAPYSLRDVRSEHQLDALRRDNHTWGDWTIMTDSYRTWISCQKIGEHPTAHIEVPKAIFDRLVDAYIKPRKAQP